ncbi:hypothetical protein CEXT_227611 [Caerostris extrusa]|uniref:Uncharacterized protein n=1 Tax=Caerostris extrusa TaxID=172846 RepID=A0AAV4QUU9_CAEEX|nr:hypothetical protein CEXT_227611 [Caerostris extrusa]
MQIRDRGLRCEIKDTYLTYTRPRNFPFRPCRVGEGAWIFRQSPHTPFHDKENRIRLLKEWINAVCFIYLFIRASTTCVVRNKLVKSRNCVQENAAQD